MRRILINIHARRQVCWRRHQKVSQCPEEPSCPAPLGRKPVWWLQVVAEVCTCAHTHTHALCVPRLLVHTYKVREEFVPVRVCYTCVLQGQSHRWFISVRSTTNMCTHFWLSWCTHVFTCAVVAAVRMLERMNQSCPVREEGRLVHKMSPTVCVCVCRSCN